MRFTFPRWILVATMLALVAGCASKPAPAGKPLLTKILVIPATEPQELTLKNENAAVVFLVPLSAVAFHLDSKSKAREFNEKMAPRRLLLAATLNATVVDALRSAGYELEVLDRLERSVDDPDDIDYDKIKSDADMILHLRVTEVGMQSPKLTPDYLPRVDISAKLYVRSRDDSIYDENLHYGIDAKARDPQSIKADPKYAYATFDEVMTRQEEIGRMFERGTASLSELLAHQLKEALETKVRRR